MKCFFFPLACDAMKSPAVKHITILKLTFIFLNKTQLSLRYFIDGRNSTHFCRSINKCLEPAI